MTMEMGFYDSAMNGIAISICFAFVILIFATCNLLVSFLAALCITSVVMILVGLWYHFFGTGQHLMAAQLCIFAMIYQIFLTLLLCSNWAFLDSTNIEMTEH